MCGISGILSLVGEKIDRKDIIKLNNKIEHRGPDAEGNFVEDNIALAHRRLSIIDPKNIISNQPFFYSNRYVLVFNGEIYNYIEIRNQLKELGYLFDTNSDTEVLLKAYLEWGEECLDILNGMWAFAIWDRIDKTLFCSRDRFGIKPLYWVKNKNQLYFASEIKQLRELNLGNKCNYEELSIFLFSGCANSSNQTFFNDINSLPPGHNLIIQRDGFIKIKSWYNLRNKIKDLHYIEDPSEFKNYLNEAIKLRMRSDVNIGASLSGGLDSSSVISIASKLLKYSGHENNFAAIHAKSTDPSFDESQYAELVCKDLDISLFKVEPTYDLFIKSIKEMVFFQDEPFASSNNLMQYTVMQKAKNLGIKVMLDGQGSDEILLGYSKSFLVTLLANLTNQGFPSALEHIFLSLRNNANLNFKSIPKYVLGNLSGTARAKYLSSKMNFLNLSIEPTKYLFKEVSKANLDPIEYQIIDIEKISLPQILRTEDRNSMAHSVEARLPFLDFNLVEYCLSLEVSEKVKKGWTKYPLRTSDILNTEIAWRKTKLGYDGPEIQWDKKFAPSMLEKIKKCPLINQISDIKELSKSWFKLSAKDRWRLFNVCVWQEIHNVDF